MNKKYIIIIAVIAIAAIAYYLFTNREKSAEELAAEATEGNTSALSKLMIGNVSAVTDDSISAEDLEYNELVAKYKEKYRSAPDSSWTISQLEERIAQYDRIKEAIDEYYRLEALIDEGDVAKTDKELSKMSLQDIYSLNKQVDYKNKRNIWNSRKKEIEQIVNQFKYTVENDGSAFKPLEYDAATLNNMLGFNKAEMVYANQYFGTLGCKTSKNYGNKVQPVYTIYNAIPTGTRWKYRKNASIATKVKNAYSSITGTVNQYGEIA